MNYLRNNDTTSSHHDNHVTAATRNTKTAAATKDIQEMEELLPSILRAHGVVEAKDGDSIDVLDGLYFKGLVGAYLFFFCI